METFNNQLLNIPVNYIKDCDNCYFINRNTIYNVDTKKFSKKRVKSSSVGYNINGNFILEKNIVKIKAERLSNNLINFVLLLKIYEKNAIRIIKER